MSDNKSNIAPLSPSEVKCLKEKLRHTLWTSDMVLREIALIQKLRLLQQPVEK